MIIFVAVFIIILFVILYIYGVSDASGSNTVYTSNGYYEDDDEEDEIIIKYPDIDEENDVLSIEMDSYDKIINRVAKTITNVPDGDTILFPILSTIIEKEFNNDTRFISYIPDDENEDKYIVSSYEGKKFSYKVINKRGVTSFIGSHTYNDMISEMNYNRRLRSDSIEDMGFPFKDEFGFDTVRISTITNVYRVMCYSDAYGLLRITLGHEYKHINAKEDIK